MNRYITDYAHPGHGKSTEVECSFLTPEYNFILFFSLPFYPISKVYKKKYFVYGHLSLALGNTVYQIHDPARLRSSFLVSRMPVEEWLFSDGAWYDWDVTSPTYRHVHLYEKAEIKRTAVFFTAFKGFPLGKQLLYQQYFEKIESDFHKGLFHFNLIFNNCTGIINSVLYREQWFRKGLFDFIPAISFKRLVSAWKRLNVPFVAGHFNESNPANFRVHKICCGLITLAPDRSLAKWITRLGLPANEKNIGQHNSFVIPQRKHHEIGRNTKTAGM